MSLLFIRKYLKVIYILAIPVYFYISYSSILNKHSHVNASGIVIVHSHAINDENENGKPINDHKHSKKEICLFQSLNFDCFDIWEGLQNERIGCIEVQQIIDQNCAACSEIEISLSSPRAPPVFIA